MPPAKDGRRKRKETQRRRTRGVCCFFAIVSLLPPSANRVNLPEGFQQHFFGEEAVQRRRSDTRTHIVTPFVDALRRVFRLFGLAYEPLSLLWHYGQASPICDHHRGDINARPWTLDNGDRRRQISCSGPQGFHRKCLNDLRYRREQKKDEDDDDDDDDHGVSLNN